MNNDDIPEDWESPDWGNASAGYDWKNYTGESMRELWPTFTNEQKKAIAHDLQETSLHENWDE